MIQTPVCKLLDIDYPIALGGMGSATSPELVSAVSNAGGLGALGCHYLTPEQIGERAAAIRGQTNKPFGLNFLLFDTREDSFAAVCDMNAKYADVVSTDDVIKYINALPRDLFELPSGVPVE
jgi:enoyl-[acyl-carrier protein] reductase II